MKKIFLLGLVLLTFISCESASENENDTPDESEIVIDEATDDSVTQPIELILEKYKEMTYRSNVIITAICMIAGCGQMN